jgi:Double-GTPase 2
MNECSRATCWAPDTGCDLGFLDRSKCPSWTGKHLPDSESSVNTDDVLMPWSGRTLGLNDLGFVAGRVKPFVVGVVGPQSAGKTTLLAAWYLLLARGLASRVNHRFIGSFSFEGWEAVAGVMRWRPGAPPHFPAHTSSREGRVPGLLHLDLRKDGGAIKSYLLADAPGEWFKKWSIQSDATESAGAAWISQHSDVFLLIADREALSGEHKGTARGSLQLIARRLSAERNDRPVALVWTKADISVSPEMETAVRDAVVSQMPDAVEFSVSVVTSGPESEGVGTGLLDLLQWVLECQRRKAILPNIAAESYDPLFLFGARR